MSRFKEMGLAALAVVGIGKAMDTDPKGQNLEQKTEAPTEHASINNVADVPSSEPLLHPENASERAENFADALVEALDDSHLDASINTQPDGTITVQMNGEWKFSVHLQPEHDGNWSATPDAKLMAWANKYNVTLQDYSLTSADGINTAISDLEDINILATQAHYVEDASIGFGAMFSESLNNNLSAEDAARAKMQDLKDAEARTERLQEDIAFAVQNGENVFVKE